MVKWTGKIVLLALALSMWAVPLMACMLPEALLTAEERECCKKMADDCGEMEMPASHSCCTVTVRQPDPFVINARFSLSDSLPVIVPLMAGGDADLPPCLTRADFQTSIHSPPVSPPAIISILRI